MSHETNNVGIRDESCQRKFRKKRELRRRRQSLTGVREATFAASLGPSVECAGTAKSVARFCRRGHSPAGRWSGKRDSNPRPSAWKADALAAELFPPRTVAERVMRGGGGRIRTSEGVRRQIYSLLPLAARAPLQVHRPPPGKRGSTDAGPLALACRGAAEAAPHAAVDDRAGEGTRTPNHLITNEMLYQLSYASADPVCAEKPVEDRGLARGCQGNGRPARSAPIRRGSRAASVAHCRLPLHDRAGSDRD